MCETLNIIQTQQYYVVLTVFHIIILDISHIQTECEKYPEIFYGILSLPHNIAMDLNNNIL